VVKDGIMARMRILALLGLVVIAWTLYLQSQNGRYQYIQNGTDDVILDTRTGEYWTGAGTTHIDARHHKIETGTTPSVIEKH
jgi:hypothetical protein